MDELNVANMIPVTAACCGPNDMISSNSRAERQADLPFRSFKALDVNEEPQQACPLYVQHQQKGSSALDKLTNTRNPSNDLAEEADDVNRMGLISPDEDSQKKKLGTREPETPPSLNSTGQAVQNAG